MKSSIITLGTNPRNYWYFFSCTVCYIFRKFCFYNLEVGEFTIKPLTLIFLMSIGMMLSYFLELISRKLQINKEADKSKKEPLQDNNIHKPLTILHYSLFILTLALLDGVGMFFVYFPLEFIQQAKINAESNKSETKPLIDLIGTEHIYVLLELVFVSILSFFFLNKRLYRHHWFFSGIMLIALVLVLFANIGASIQIPPKFYCGIIASLFHSIYYVIYKYYMDKKFISIYLSLAIEGTVIFILSLLIGIFTRTTWALELNSYNVWLSIRFVLSSLGYNIFLLLLIRRFCPTHKSVTGIFNTVLELIILLIIEDRYKYHSVFLMVIGDVILMFGALGFNEILILHKCNLDYDTENVINYRAESEKNDLEVIERKMSKIKIVQNKVGEEDDN